MNFFVRRMKFSILVIGIILLWLINSFLLPVYKCKDVDKSSRWYSNDIYMSDQYYYDNLLDDAEKEAYGILFDNVKKMNKSFSISTNGISFPKVWNAFITDHPELINVTTYYYTYSGNNINIKPKYLTNSKISLKLKERKIRKIIGKVKKATRKMDEFETEKYIYEFLGKKSGYGSGGGYSDQSAYTAFTMTSNTVCAGYGKAAQLLLSNCGIESHININDNHLWNTVKLDGEYYFFDATLTGIYVNKEHTLDNVSHRGLNQNESSSNYKIIYPDVSPKVEGKKYNYFDYNGLTLTYSEDILSKIKQIIDDCEYRVVEIKFTNSSEALRGINSNLSYLGLESCYDYTGYATGDGILTLVKRK